MKAYIKMALPNLKFLNKKEKKTSLIYQEISILLLYNLKKKMKK